MEARWNTPAEDFNETDITLLGAGKTLFPAESKVSTEIIGSEIISVNKSNNN